MSRSGDFRGDNRRTYGQLLCMRGPGNNSRTLVVYYHESKINKMYNVMMTGLFIG